MQNDGSGLDARLVSLNDFLFTSNMDHINMFKVGFCGEWLIFQTPELVRILLQTPELGWFCEDIIVDPRLITVCDLRF